ncbi:unnamed protein product, partial [Toxocara canis]|uniref:NR LBD domain-containing protein n=1 Tax=Toxocara canis TaxID=6265 RepID=A0A183U6L0_TOXCA
IVLFKNFFSYYTNSDRAFQSYRAFGRDPNNDRLLMPDGGYIKMSELEKFYENTINCKADPMEAARIFRPVMTFIVNAIVGHMRRIEMSEYEYVAMLGMFLWNDALSNIAKETIEVVWSTRSAIFEDLHIHYRSRGLSDIQASVKLGNLMLLIPKIQVGHFENITSQPLFTMNDYTLVIASIFSSFTGHCIFKYGISCAFTAPPYLGGLSKSIFGGFCNSFSNPKILVLLLYLQLQFWISKLRSVPNILCEIYATFSFPQPHIHMRKCFRTDFSVLGAFVKLTLR